MREQNNRNQTETLYQKVRNTIEKNKQAQLFNKAFLRPIQIALKTSATQNELQKIGSMPYGLKQVIKMNINDNKFVLDNFKSISQGMETLASMPGNEHKKIRMSKGQYDIQDIKTMGCDNLISLLKKNDFGHNLKLAICVCMYSEDKTELKKTLAGINRNIAVFNSQGISANQIGVFVIMDGIEVVNKSVQQFYEEMQKQSYLYLNQDVAAVDQKQFIDQNRQVQDQQVDNINALIFDQEQLRDRKQRRFINRKNQYIKCKNMIKQIQKLEKDKTLTFDVLDGTLQQFFIEKAKKQYKKDYGATDRDLQDKQITSKLMQIYAYDLKRSRPIIQAALSQAKKYCKQYIETRNDLALLNCFRVPIVTALFQQNQRSNQFRRNHQQQQLNQQQERQSEILKMNLFMVTRYKNKGKLASHDWFFNGFCQQLRPQYAILLDVGLAPEKQALWKMIKHMQDNQKIGGVCGYMGLRIQRVDQSEQIKDENVDCITSLCMKFVDIQRAQQFEYHFAHLIDKPFEASFNFIHVLPGAFSAYRMKAIRPQHGADSKLLKQYFKSIQQNSNKAIFYKSYPYTAIQTICRVILPQYIYYCIYEKPRDDSFQKVLYDENVYLAQDRTLCMGIHQNGYNLAYLPDANAWVDPIKTLYALLGQRKRWINGSYFAFQKVKDTLYSSRATLQKQHQNTQYLNRGQQQQNTYCLLKIQIFYLNIMNMLGYIAPALFMYTIHIAMYTLQTNVIVATLQQLNIIQNNASAVNNPVVNVFVYTVDFIYAMMFFGLIFYSMHLTNRDNKFKSFFYGVSTAYGIFSIAVFGVLVYDIISGFASGKNAFLLENPWFVQAIVGGQVMIDSLRYIMLGIMGLYALPIIVFMLFCRLDYIIDILFSTFSFIFYSPTYLNILNIYALCRIDDISWGTKGLDSGTSGLMKQKQDDWKKIKLIHVSKFVFYNIVVAFLLLLFGDQYVVRFYLTFSIMVILGITLTLKVIIGACYLIKYRCFNSINVSQNKYQLTNTEFHDDLMNNFTKVKNSIYRGIQQRIKNIGDEVKTSYGNLTVKKLNSIIETSTILSKNFKFSNRNKLNAFQNFSRIQLKNSISAKQAIGEFKNKQTTQGIEKIENQKKPNNPTEEKIEIQQQSFYGLNEDKSKNGGSLNKLKQASVILNAGKQKEGKKQTKKKKIGIL